MALPQRHHGAHAAIVELDALPYSVRTAAEDDDRTAPGLRRLALLVVAAVEIRCGRRELAGAGIDHLVRRPHLERPAPLADVTLALAAQRRKLAIGCLLYTSDAA